MPISAPNPNSLPSVKRVEALTITAALSSRLTKRRAAGCERVTIASVWPLPHRRMWSVAASSESTTPTARSSDRYSAAQSSSPAGSEADRCPAARASACRTTPSSAFSTRGRNSAATASCTSSVSAALHTDGRVVLASTTIDTAMSRSASAST